MSAYTRKPTKFESLNTFEYFVNDKRFQCYEIID